MNVENRDGIDEEFSLRDNTAAKVNLAPKRKADDAPTSSAPPPKMGKSEVVDEGKSHLSDADDDFVLDVDQAGEADFGVRPIPQWSSGVRNVSVKAVFVKVNYNRAAINEKPAVYTVMIEDSSEATNICAFGADAERLKTALAGLEGTQLIFSGLTSRIPDANYARYLPGNVNFELNFNKFSEVKPFQHANTNTGLEMPRDFSTAYGRQKDSKVYLSLSTVSDVVKIAKDQYHIERKLKGLKFLERP